MRLEELGNGQYVKVPDKTESDLIKVVNRFFNSDMEEFDDSKEAIILESQRRLKPLIVNLTKRIAWEQGQEIYGPIIEKLVEETIAGQLGAIKDLVDKLKQQITEHYIFRVDVTNDTTTQIDFPTGKKVSIVIDVVMVTVNGLRQYKDIHYSVMGTIDHVTHIVFNNPLGNGDTVEVECWLYNI